MPHPSNKKNQPGQTNFSDPHDILNNAPIGIFTSTPEGRFIAANSTMARIFGYDSPEDLMESVKDIASQMYADPSDREKFTRLLEVQGEVVSYECRLRRRNGTEFWGSISSRTVSGQDGTISHYHVFIKDITKRKRVKEALKESEIRLRSMLSAVPDLMFVFSLEGIFLDFHSSGYSLMALKPWQLLGRPVSEVLPGTASEKFLYSLQQAHKKKRLVLFEFNLNEQGESRHFEGRVTSMDDQRLLVIVRDITRRKRAEEIMIRVSKEVEAAHQRLLTVLDNIEALIFVTDMQNYEILFANKFTRNTFGSIEGQKCWEVIHFDRTAPCESCIKQKILDEKGSSTGVYRREYWNTKTDRWYDCRDSAIRWIDGRTVRLEMAVDITERKLADEKIKEINQQLRRTLTERDKFFSIIAHDLRSPLVGFLIFIKMLTERIEKLSLEEIQRLAGNMKRSAENLYDLLENLLEWSVMQRGAGDFIPVPCCLADEVNKNIDLIQANAVNKNIIIKCAVPEDLDKVFADRSMLNTVLRNVLSNAVKFSDRNGTVFVSAVANGCMILISVEDQGVGMDLKTRSKLFALGQISSRKGTAGEIGTGLGLILCKEFVNKHGGEIWVESEPGQGTKVFFTLPMDTRNS